MRSTALIVGTLLLGGAIVGAQIQTPGAGPGDASGLGPVVAGPDFSGSWRPQQLVLESQTAAGDLADYGGIPLNDAARLYALSWPASRQTVRQHQCMGYVTPYFWYAPGNYRIWQERDPFTQRLTATNAIEMHLELPAPPGLPPGTYTGTLNLVAITQ